MLCFVFCLLLDVSNQSDQQRFLQCEELPQTSSNTDVFVQVWLAALRETDKQDSTDQHIICEDHFLPEDVSINGVISDAIPIMPPYLDGPLGMISPWGAESSEEEDQWAIGDDEEDEGGEEAPVVDVKLPAPDPPQQVRTESDVMSLIY